VAAMIALVAVAVLAFVAGVGVGILVSVRFLGGAAAAVAAELDRQRAEAIRNRSRRPVERLWPGAIADEDPVKVLEDRRLRREEERAGKVSAFHAVWAERKR
jgi:hypothetical protein